MSPRRWIRWPQRADQEGEPPSRLAFGADYNPEQWPERIWPSDVRAMRAAGVNIVSLAIFSWARIQPAEDVCDFGWLDRIMDLLHEGGVAVSLATATASPPPWLTTRYPEILPVNREGATLWPGARQHWRPTSPVFRTHALRLVEAMARRYADHPALALWHVSNELGCHNAFDYSDDAARAFRDWLRARYGEIDRLNEAWATSFWSQRYSDWEQVLPPRLAASYPNPAQRLDFQRFSSDALRDYLRAECAVLGEVTPDVPLTTNFMIMGDGSGVDYDSWVDDVDFISNDHYSVPGPQSLDELSFSANLTGHLARGGPWYLMEHAPSAVNWQLVNVAKRRGEMARDSLTHVAHGADAVCFFQWRQSRGGAEMYHSAMVPHAGEDTEVFRSVTDLGKLLRDLAGVCGTRQVPARVAIVVDQTSAWAVERESQPSGLLRYRQEALDWYSALLDLGIRADVVPLSGPVETYQVLIAPILHVVGEDLASRLASYVDGGGHLVTTYFSGIVDECDRAWLGGYPGALRDLLGVRVEEFMPLLDGERVSLDNGTEGTLWTEPVDVVSPDVEVLARYADGDLAGRPAITRRVVGRGSAAYLSTRLGPAGIQPALSALLDRAGVASELPESARGRVELAIRGDDQRRYWFLVNRTSEFVDLSEIAGTRLAGTSGVSDGRKSLEPRGVMVVEA